MLRLTYTSNHRNSCDLRGYSATMEEIGQVAAVRNQEVGVTGFLICTPSWYAQILEGAAEDVENIFARIQRDTRHFNVTVLERRLIKDRLFDTWSMGWRHASMKSKMLFLEEGLAQDGLPVSRQCDSIHRTARNLAEIPDEFSLSLYNAVRNVDGYTAA